MGAGRGKTGLWGKITAGLTPGKPGWLGASLALGVIALVLVGAMAAGMAFTDFTVHKGKAFGIFLALLLAGGLGIAGLYYILRALSPLYRWTLFLAFPVLFSLIGGYWGMPGGMIAMGAITLGSGLLVGALFTLGARGWVPWQRPWTYLVGIAGALILVLCVQTFNASPKSNEFLDDFVLEDRTLDLPNPGIPGPYEVETFAYGSGKDLHRPEFASQADWLSRSVDGSKLVANWSGASGTARTAYWGFDDKALPVQGRVWAPKGEGPFPLVLIVHGNHSMEDYSDPGYAYLGELLASRGYIFVSVDENFLNSSFADFVGLFGGGLNEENDARGWLLLEHLAQWREWSMSEGHPFAARVDMDRLGLIGHSRGGEAVAIAAAFNTLDHYPDNAAVSFDYKFNLRGVIAIAPVDGQYKPRRNGTPISDVNYFVIHGGMDGDVSSFMGASQWTRAAFTGDEYRFKASLYVPFANHGQFNTSWGRYDSPVPYAYGLDTRQIMDGEEQRQVARVYFSAFLDAAVKDKAEYLPLMRDARQGADWLPQGYYINNYQDAGTKVIAGYEEDIEAGTASLPGAKISGEGLSVWRESWASLKWRPLETHLAVLGWDERFNSEAASYEVTWDPGAVTVEADGVLRFAAAQAKGSTLPAGFKPPETDTNDPAKTASEIVPAPTATALLSMRKAAVQGFMKVFQAAEEEKPAGLDWSIVLADEAGEEARLALSDDMVLFPQFVAHTIHAPGLSGRQPSEIVLRRFSLPLERFAAVNPALDLARLNTVRFEFDRSKRGLIVLDDIGFSGGVVEAVEEEAVTHVGAE